MITVLKEVPVCSAAFSPDGRRIVAGGVAEAQVGDAETGVEIAFLQRGRRAEDELFPVFSPDGRHILTKSARTNIQCWWSSYREPRP